MKRIRVNTSKPYDVVIERGSINKCGKYIAEIAKSKKAAIISDDIVEELYGETVINSLKENGFECTMFSFKNGEASKNLSVLSDIYEFLCASNITRNDLIIALGGGVVGDITGFAAATFLRGVEFVQIPTTLLAQIDSSVGGKTAVDLKCGKNLAGAFKQPALVICDSNTLKTLTPEILADGMAEAIKYGMIRDEKLFDLIAQHNLDNVDEVMDEIVYTCIDIKRIVVENDEFDRGERMILNFGHTIGHAIEGYHNYINFTHGKGVAAGMAYITRRFAPDLSEQLENCIKAYRLPIDSEAPMNELLPFCSKDKKRESGNINYIVCKEIGKAEIVKTTVAEFNRLMEEA
ncbi:MAG: 3-dehydroquinate synthase [Ruminococcus sp.]|nr:3-dehydroquinate synthase [Ruminococcus sp.]